MPCRPFHRLLFKFIQVSYADFMVFLPRRRRHLGLADFLFLRQVVKIALVDVRTPPQCMLAGTYARSWSQLVLFGSARPEHTKDSVKAIASFCPMLT
jgi:hypothetical protein